MNDEIKRRLSDLEYQLDEAGQSDDGYVADLLDSAIEATHETYVAAQHPKSTYQINVAIEHLNAARDELAGSGDSDEEGSEEQ